MVFSTCSRKDSGTVLDTLFSVTFITHKIKYGLIDHWDSGKDALSSFYHGRRSKYVWMHLYTKQMLSNFIKICF